MRVAYAPDGKLSACTQGQVKTRVIACGLQELRAWRKEQGLPGPEVKRRFEVATVSNRSILQLGDIFHHAAK